MSEFNLEEYATDELNNSIEKSASLLATLAVNYGATVNALSLVGMGLLAEPLSQVYTRIVDKAAEEAAEAILHGDFTPYFRGQAEVTDRVTQAELAIKEKMFDFAVILAQFDASTSAVENLIVAKDIDPQDLLSVA